jgi:hypothetical protein
MAKRFTDTEKYRKEFIRSLPGAYKLLWDFIVNECNHAGIWYVDFEIAQICVGRDMPVGKDKALCLFNEGEDRILELENGKKWFIIPFIAFQYGKLGANNLAHKGIISELRYYNLINNNLEIDLQQQQEASPEGLQRGFKAPKEMEMEMEMENRKGGVGENQNPGNTPEPPKEKTWRDSFETYRQELRSAYMQAIEDKKWLAERQRYHPGLNILLTLEKACKDYWSKEAGWKKKKAAKTANIDWPRTFNNALAIDSNKVWKTKKQIESEENEQKKHIRI